MVEVKEVWLNPDVQASDWTPGGQPSAPEALRAARQKIMEVTREPWNRNPSALMEISEQRPADRALETKMSAGAAMPLPGPSRLKIAPPERFFCLRQTCLEVVEVTRGTGTRPHLWRWLVGESWLMRTKRDGGARRNRTADLLNAIQALYQLSYSPERPYRNAEAGG